MGGGFVLVAHVLSKLNIAKFDGTDSRRVKIAELCREGHGKKDIFPYIHEIDHVVEEIYYMNQ